MTNFVQACRCPGIGLPSIHCPIHDPRPATTTTAVCTRCIELEDTNARLRTALDLICNLSNASLKASE